MAAGTLEQRPPTSSSFDLRGGSVGPVAPEPEAVPPPALSLYAAVVEPLADRRAVERVDVADPADHG